MDAIYLRISEDKAGLELGVTRQRKDCRRLARKGALEFCDNDISATKGKPRPQYKAMMAAVEAGKVDRIICWMQSRVWRNRAERARAFEVLQRHGVTLVCVKGATIDFATATGRMVAGIIGETDTAESAIKTERLEAWATQRAEAGQWHGGRPPYGYTDAMRIDRAAAKIVRQQYADLLAGHSIAAIARQAGIPRHVARTRLTNPHYAALRIHKGVEYPGTWKALVPEQTWRAAVAILSDASRDKGGGGAPRRHLGSGLYVCERCERPVMAAHYVRGDIGRYSVYRCRQDGPGDACGRQWRMSYVDAYVEELVRGRLRQVDELARLLPRDRPDLDALTEEARTIKAGLLVLAGDVFKGVDVAAEVTKQKTRLVEIEALLSAHAPDPVLGGLLAADDPVAFYEAGDVGRKQAIVRLLMTVTLGPAPRGRTPGGLTDDQAAAWYARQCVTPTPR